MASAFDNQSTNQLADDYGALKAQSDALDARMKELKAELINRNATHAAGERFQITISEQTTIRYDDKAIREALGPEICQQYAKPSTSHVVRVKPVAQPLAA